MGVTEVTSESHFNTCIKDAKGKLVVVDFFATWCGPCKTIAPIYSEWSNKYTKEAVFLKLDVDKVREVAQSAGVKNLPSFGFYHEGKLLDLVVGGNPKVMEDKIKALAEKHSTFAFRGTGNSLVGASSAAAAAPKPAAAATTAASAPARRNPWADPNFHLAKKVTSDAAPAAASSTPAAKPAATTAAAAPKPATTSAPAASGSAAAAGGNRVNPWASKDAKDIAPAAAAAPAPAAAAAPTPAAAPTAASTAAPAATPAAPAAAAPSSASAASAAAPAAASAGTGKNDPSLTKQLNPEFLNGLMGMGFSQLRAEKALILTGNKGVDQALNYLMENENAPDIDEPLQVVGTSSGGASSSSSGPNLDDMDDDERAIFEQLQKKKMAEKGVAFAGGANAAPAKKSTLDMTHEEKMQWLENRRAEVKLRKEAEAIAAIKDKEAQRKKTVIADHKADELREAMQRKQADDALRIKRKEEEDRKKARAATLAKLEEDKKRRREQHERELAAIAAQKAAATAAPKK